MVAVTGAGAAVAIARAVAREEAVVLVKVMILVVVMAAVVAIVAVVMVAVVGILRSLPLAHCSTRPHYSLHALPCQPLLHALLCDNG